MAIRPLFLVCKNEEGGIKPVSKKSGKRCDKFSDYLVENMDLKKNKSVLMFLRYSKKPKNVRSLLYTALLVLSACLHVQLAL